jgi:hypothetical protein
MDQLSEQEQDPRIRKLRKLAGGLPLPQEGGRDWNALERSVLRAVEGDGHVSLAGLARSVLHLVARPLVWAPTAAALCGILALAVGLSVVRSRQAGALTTRVDGTVEACTRSGGPGAGNSGWRALAVGSRVRAGATVRTADGALLCADIGPGTGFVLQARSLLTVEKADSLEQRYVLDQGSVRVQLARRSAEQSLVVLTPNALCQAIGTVFTVVVGTSATPTTLLQVQRGAVLIRSRRYPEDTRTVEAPFSVSLIGDHFGSQYAIMPPDTSSISADSLLSLLAAADAVDQGIAPLPMPTATLSGLIPDAKPPVPPPQAAPEWPRPTSVGRVDSAARATVPSGRALASAADAPIAVGGSAAPAQRRILDSTQVAGDLLGTIFYWERSGLKLDTLGWDKLMRRHLDTVDARARGPAGTAGLARQRGKRFYRLKDATALSVSLLTGLGYPVIMLTQWSGFVGRSRETDSKDLTDRTGTLSDWHWEQVDRAALTRPGGTQTQYSVRLYFSGNGCSDFLGPEQLDLSRSQIMGTPGLSLWEHKLGYLPEANQYRLIVACYIVVGVDRSASQVIADVEMAMDAHGLDFSYRPPQLVEVK